MVLQNKAKKSLCFSGDLASRATQSHRNPLVAHLNHRQVFRGTRGVENHADRPLPTSSTRAPEATPN